MVAVNLADKSFCKYKKEFYSVKALKLEVIQNYCKFNNPFRDCVPIYR